MALVNVGNAPKSSPVSAPAKAPQPETVEPGSPEQDFAELQADVLSAYENGVTADEGERLAAKFLHAQMAVSKRLATRDLDRRMRKNGHKTMRAQKYLEILGASEKKPTEAAIDSMITVDKLVCETQDGHERAEVDAEALRRLYDMFKDAHIYFRGIGRGTNA